MPILSSLWLKRKLSFFLIRGIHIKKEKSKLSVFTDNILYLENPKEPIKKTEN